MHFGRPSAHPRCRCTRRVRRAHAAAILGFSFHLAAHGHGPSVAASAATSFSLSRCRSPRPVPSSDRLFHSQVRISVTAVRFSKSANLLEDQRTIAPPATLTIDIVLFRTLTSITGHARVTQETWSLLSAGSKRLSRAFFLLRATMYALLFSSLRTVFSGRVRFYENYRYYVVRLLEENSGSQPQRGATEHFEGAIG